MTPRIIITAIMLCLILPHGIDAKVREKPDENGLYIQEWKQWEKLRYKDRPLQKRKILEGIKEEAKEKHLSRDFFKAGQELVSLIQSTNWKIKDEALNAWEEELTSFGEPMLLYMHYRRMNWSNHALRYALEHKEELQASNSEGFLRNPYDDVFDVDNDLETILWNHLRDTTAQRELLVIIAGRYPQEAVARREIAIHNPEALTELTREYAQTPFSPVLRSDLLLHRWEQVRGKNDSEDVYRLLLNDCQAYLKDIQSMDLKPLKHWDYRMDTCIKDIIETLQKPTAQIEIHDDEIFVTGRNLRKIRLKTDDGRNIRLRNEAERLYVLDTLTTPLPVFTDGRHSIQCTFSGTTSAHTTYEQYSLSVALRNDDGKYSIYVGDYLSGEPVHHVKVQLQQWVKTGRLFRRFKTSKIVEEIDLDGFTPLPDSFQELLKKNQGEITCSCPVGTDEWRLSAPMTAPLLENDCIPVNSIISARIYRSQGAYRPGDTLNFKAIAYEGNPQRHLKTVREGTRLKVIVKDADGKEISSMMLMTNDFGSIHYQTVLPAGHRNGLYLIEIYKGKDLLATETFRVDEFILPSFRLVFNPINEIPKAQQTFHVTGRIESYSAHPLSDLHLSAVLKRGNIEYRASAAIADNGWFSLPFKVSVKGKYDLTVNVTDAGGESHVFTKNVYVNPIVTSTASLLNAAEGKADIPTLGVPCPILRQNDAILSVSLNVLGEQLEQDVPYSISNTDGECLLQGIAKPDTPIHLDLSAFPDGVLFFQTHFDDSLAATNNEMCFVKLTGGQVSTPVRSWFLSGKSDVDDRIEARIGSSESQVWGVATLYSPSGAVLDKRCFHLDARKGNAHQDLSYPYPESYPDAVRLDIFYFREGGACHYSQEYYKKKADCNMPLAFSRFRDRTSPRDSCRISIKGIPSSEAVAAVWDASQDAIGMLNWDTVVLEKRQMKQPGYRILPGMKKGWKSFHPISSQQIIQGIVLDAEGEPIVGAYILVKGTSKGAATDLDGHFSLEGDAERLTVSCLGYKSCTLIASPYMVIVLEEDDALLDEVVVIGYGARSRSFVAGIQVKGTENPEKIQDNPEVPRFTELPALPELPLREVFTQGLLFEPFLYPDEKGEFSFQVSTSDKLSAYHVAVFAHDKEMHNAAIRRDMIVTLPLKVSVHEPRYLYEGDSLRLTASVSNLSGEPVSGRMCLGIGLDDDAEDRMVPYVQALPLQVPASGTASAIFTIGVPPAFHPGFVSRTRLPHFDVRLVFESDGFSDGVRVSIPVLGAEQVLTESYSAFLAQEEDAAARVDSLRTCFVNIPGSEAEVSFRSLRSLVGEGLSELTGDEKDDVISLSSAFYAGVMLKAEKDSVLLERILACRNADGGFSWLPKMESSPRVTAVLLERFAHLREKGIDIPLENTVHWLDSIQFNRPWWKGGVSDEQYLLVRSLWADVAFGRNKPGRYFRYFARKYLTPGKYDYARGDVLYRARRTATLLQLTSSDAGMALARNVGEIAFPAARFKKAIEEDCRSLREYAQPHPGGGIYYPNAVWPYRGLMDSEAYAHVLIARLLPDYSDGLLTWLLLQKETQSWGNDPAFVDALTLLSSAPDSLLEKKNVVLTAHRTIPFSEITAVGNGMTISRKFYRDASHLEILPDQKVDVGEKIIAKYFVWSAENRSFVRLDAWREAALEPCEPISGPYWGGALGGYRNVRPDHTEFWFDSWPEETIVLTEEFFVTRAGRFRAPAITIESVYAPHYRANTAAPAPLVCR